MASSFAVVTLLVALIGAASPASSNAAPGWVNCGNPGEGTVAFIAEVKARMVTCPRARDFARSYERKVFQRSEFFPRRHRGFRCSERMYGTESNRFNCRRGQKRISYIIGF
jgi:hypothetical protein